RVNHVSFADRSISYEDLMGEQCPLARASIRLTEISAAHSKIGERRHEPTTFRIESRRCGFARPAVARSRRAGRRPVTVHSGHGFRMAYAGRRHGLSRIARRSHAQGRLLSAPSGSKDVME